MLQLIQFRHSPYNEKVRWALDLKAAPHLRKSVLPGPHVGTVKRLTGRSGTPVLVYEQGALDGSAAIVQWLDARFPQSPLIPTAEAARSEALRIQHLFDEDLTPRIRRTVLATLLESPRYFAAIFGEGHPAWQQWLYACIVPLAAPLVRKGNGIRGERDIEDGHRAAEQALEFVAGKSAATGYLAGEALSIADVAAAATLAVLVRPQGSPMSLPQPVAAPYAALVKRYAAHPGAAWVRQIYAAHRAAKRDFDGPSSSAA